VHICVVTNRPVEDDARARVDVKALERAGNRVDEVRVVSPSEPMPPDATGVPSRVPRGGGLAGTLLRRAQPAGLRRSDLARRVAAAAAATGADLFYPIPTNLLAPAARAAGRRDGAVMRTPAQPDAGAVDLVRLAPHHPELATPPAGLGPFHTPSHPEEAGLPVPGRHAGRKVVMAYRKTDSNPGKYLESALRRSGADVRLVTHRLDFDTLEPGTDLVLFVEGPYPAIEVTGSTPDVPVLFWFHHGEHHLHANLRLADRYRADAVLQAHSWHLSHWVQAPVHRFPFGVPTDLLEGDRPLEDRRHHVALVGAKLWEGGPYGRRQQIVAELEAAYPPELLGFAEQVTAAEMAALYEEARLVVNEGGTRHYPITMRVFEAVGAGAVLLTDDLPGTDLLFEPGRHYAVLEEDVVGQVRRLLADPVGLQRMATDALDHARHHHTYDHRVDQLFEVAGSTPKRAIPERRAASALAGMVDRDAEVQRVAQLGAPDLASDLDSRQVYDVEAVDPARMAPGKMETVAVRADDVSEVREVLRAARRYIYVEGAGRGLDDFLAEEQPQASAVREGDVTRVDLMAESYRVLPHEIVEDPHPS
jgi:hypothetical protein